MTDTNPSLSASDSTPAPDQTATAGATQDAAAAPLQGQVSPVPGIEDPRVQTLVHHEGQRARLVAFPEGTLTLIMPPAACAIMSKASPFSVRSLKSSASRRGNAPTATRSASPNLSYAAFPDETFRSSPPGPSPASPRGARAPRLSPESAPPLTDSLIAADPGRRRLRSRRSIAAPQRLQETFRCLPIS